MIFPWHPVYLPSGYCWPVHEDSYFSGQFCFSRWCPRVEESGSKGFGRSGCYVFGGGNNGMMARLTRLRPPRDADSLSLQAGGGFSRPGARWSSSRTCKHYGWDRRFAWRNNVFTERRRASITCPTGCYRDDSYTRHVQHRHTTIVDALDRSDRENREASGGKTHRRSMDRSNEFRCRDYLWDRCRPGRRRHRHFVRISRHIPSFKKIRGRMVLW